MLEQHKSLGQTTEASIAVTNITNTDATKRKLGFKEKREFESLEIEITALEQERTQLTNALSQSNIAYELIQQMSNRIIEIQTLLETKELRWLELSEMI